MSKKYLMHVISGTHWDREWRHTAEQSKSRLVELMDTIIDLLETKTDYKCFCVDGGTIVLEDYLTIRPENKERIQQLIASGKMSIVNWYTLPETFTVAPESLIRNLLLGTGMAKAFGGGMDSGYTATSYGQTSQLPQIYKGFGINTAIFYRGTNKHVLPPFFKWEGLDGSQLYTLKTFDEVTRTNWFFYVHQPLVLGKPCRDLTYTYDRNHCPVHMCDEGLYERGFVLLKEELQFNQDPEALEKAMDAILNQARPYAVGKHLLAMNMEDNDQPFALLPEMIEKLNRISPDVELIQNSLDDYMDALIEEMKGKEMHVHRGELRYPAVEYGFNALLGATHASRTKLKVLNDAVETHLIYQAEPFAAIASLYGKEYPKVTLERAWVALLKNHAHDTICGAAVDRAHEDMLYNFSIAKTVAEEVTARSIIALVSNIDTAKSFCKDTDHTITLFNMSDQPRKEVVPLTVDLPQAANAEVMDIGVEGIPDCEYFDIVDEKGRKMEYEVLSCEKIKIGVERELDTKAIKFPANRRRILLNAEMPQMGYTTYALRFRGPNYVKHPETGPNRPLIARENGVLENEYLKVTIHPNGTFSLCHKETGRWMENLHYFTDSGETGSAHISNQPQRNPVFTSIGSGANITMLESNLLRGRYRIELTMKVPAAATVDARDRLREMTEIPITCWLTLEKGAKVLKIKTRLRNEARDHKLCVNLPSGVKTDYATVESAFAVEKRKIRWTQSEDNFEPFFPFQPMQNFVDVNDGQVGLAVLNKGLREYEVKDDADRTIALTLLRTHRAYMTANTDMTPEEFDQYTGLHSFGDLEYHYALYPHTGDWDEGEVLGQAYQYKVDIKAIQGVPMEGNLPSTNSFFNIEPVGNVMISALKASEDGSGIIMRVWNTTSEKQKVKITTMLPVRAVKRVRLDETPLGDIGMYGDTIVFDLGPHKIETLLLVQ